MVMTGTYTLQQRRLRWKKVESAECPLCHIEVEDTIYFLECCHLLQPIRSLYLNRIQLLLPNRLHTSLTQALLDSRTLVKLHQEMVDNLEEIEFISRDYIYTLHLKGSSMTEKKRARQ